MTLSEVSDGVVAANAEDASDALPARLLSWATIVVMVDGEGDVVPTADAAAAVEFGKQRLVLLGREAVLVSSVVVASVVTETGRALAADDALCRSADGAAPDVLPGPSLPSRMISRYACSVQVVADGIELEAEMPADRAGCPSLLGVEADDFSEGGVVERSFCHDSEFTNIHI